MSFFGKLSSIFSQPNGQKSPQKQSLFPKHKKEHQYIVQGKGTQASTDLQRSPQVHNITHSQLKPTMTVDTSVIVREAQTKAREIIIEAKDEALRVREQAEKDVRQLRQETQDKERSIDKKLFAIESRLKVLDEREKELGIKQTDLQNILKQTEETRAKLLGKLEKAGGLTKDQAKQHILESTEKQLTKEIAQLIQAAENRAKEEADEKAKEILVDSMFHGATSYVAEYTVSTVALPDEEVKGKIIGRDGRNIKTFEQSTGVDIDLDDQQGKVRLSSFDPVRREIAKISLEQLIRDGRIQPTRIEETVQKVTSELKKIMFEEGKKLCHSVGVYNLPADLIQLLGKFKYRFSYGQNLITHTLEETKIGIALANEIHANVETVKLGCLLHDIGKVVEGEEGSHVEIGVNLLKKYNIPTIVIDCVAQHHEDEPFSSKESMAVYIADAMSGARPGARYENYDEYVKRLKKLEDIAKEYDAVRDAYAIQAGREVRVILNPESSNDDDTIILSHKIKERVQKELTYPGTVTVTVIRELRAVDVAK